MGDTASRGDRDHAFPKIRQAAPPTVADQVFAALQQRILTLALPPRTRMSEADVAEKMGVSRQPVREAFKRLAKLGFLQIRPQSGTTVAPISEEAVLRARFIRTALEIQTCRRACETLTQTGLDVLAALVASQKSAVAAQDRALFHALDDQFHREICVQSGVGFVWDLIHDNKAHMDRIRMLSLSLSSQRLALEEHVVVFEAIAARDADAASAAITRHLSRILALIDEVKALDHSWFTDTAA